MLVETRPPEANIYIHNPKLQKKNQNPPSREIYIFLTMYKTVDNEKLP